MSESENLELKKRSRRRLVGAAALALFAAIVLPMVMDQEPAAPVQDIQITIPEREANAALARPIGGQDQAAEPQLAPPPEEQAPSPVATAEPTPPAPGADVVPPPASAAKAPLVVDDASARSARQPETRSSPTPAAKVDEAERAKAILEGRKPAAATPAEAFVVQVGAFAEAGKAGSIAAELKKRGIQAYTEKVGTMTRVRVGPFVSRADAELAAQRVKAGGFGGAVMSR